MTEPAAVVLYEERDDVAFITINRPEKKNTLTEAVIAGIADGIDRATASRGVRAVVLRGAGGVLCAGYDLTGDQGGPWQSPDRPGLQLSGWTSPYDAPGPEALFTAAFSSPRRPFSWNGVFCGPKPRTMNRPFP